MELGRQLRLDLGRLGEKPFYNRCRRFVMSQQVKPTADHLDSHIIPQWSSLRKEVMQTGQSNTVALAFRAVPNMFTQ